MSRPELIGRYRIERRLGTGAFGVVWLAHDDRLQAPVAVKVMADNWAYRLDVRERFLAEARLLRKATSGGVVQVFDVGELPDERPYFVMEYADLGTLEDRASMGPLAPHEALWLTARAARGASGLHGAGIVHRDIKPSNVLLASRPDGKERVLLADLGLAKNLAQASGLTVVAGSVGYMAPEQMEPYDGIDGRADVYSLGAVLYRLVTGTAPAASGRVLPPAEVLPGVPDEVGAAVLRAMEQDRERRWPSAEAFADELDQLTAFFDEGARTTGGTVLPGAAGLRRDAASGVSAGRDSGRERSSGTGPAQGRPPGADGPKEMRRSGGPGSVLDGSSGRGPSLDPDHSGGSAGRPDSPFGSVGDPAGSPGRSTLPGGFPGPFTGQGSPERGSSPEIPRGSLDAWARQEHPAAAGAGPHGAGRGGRRTRVLALVAATVVVLGGAGAAYTLTRPPAAPADERVTDATGRVSLRVPSAWAKQVVESGWSPTAMGLKATHQPGLTVADDAGRWPDLKSPVNGVFVGIDDEGGLEAKAGSVQHPSCRYGGSRTFSGSGLHGTVRAWSSCGGPGLSVEEAALAPVGGAEPEVYVQIRSDGGPDRADAILRSLRVTA
jgi:serine/threonine protein kinase